MVLAIRRIRRLPLTYGLFPTAVKKAVNVRRPADTIFVSGNKQNRSEAAVIAAGASHVDENPGQVSSQNPAQRAGCLRYDEVKAYCIENGVPRTSALTKLQCYEIAVRLFNHSRRPGVGNLNSEGLYPDGGRGFETSQMGEVPDADVDYAVKYDEASMEIERQVAILHERFGLRYFGGYDGCIRSLALYWEGLSLSDLDSDDSVLAWLRKPIVSPGGNRSFLPFNSFGQAFRGQLEYMECIVQFYYQGAQDPGEAVADASFRLAAARAGLRAFVAEKDGNGNDYYSAQRKAIIAARRICAFIWASMAETGNAHVTTKIAAPGGEIVGTAFMPTAWAVMWGISVVAFIETKCAYFWNDTTRYGEDITVTQGNYTFDGVAVGYFGTATPRTAPVVHKFTPSQTDVGCPYVSWADDDLGFDAENTVSKARGWVGDATGWQYGRCQSGDESTLCPAYNDRTYAFHRGRNRKGIAYVWYNAMTNRASVIYLNYHLAPHLTERVYVEINGLKVDLGTCEGGLVHGFCIQMPDAGSY